MRNKFILQRLALAQERLRTGRSQGLGALALFREVVDEQEENGKELRIPLHLVDLDNKVARTAGSLKCLATVLDPQGSADLGGWH